MNAIAATSRPSLVRRIAGRYDVDPDKMLETLTRTVLKTEKPATPEQLMAILIVADRYSLDPFTREIFAFEDKRGGIVPVVSVDGWAKILNDHAQFDGVDFKFEDTTGAPAATVPAWCECTIYRKDRTHPIVVREFFAEVKRDTQPWKSHPRRMLRHKTLIQCARIAMGFSGIFDEDEAQRIVAGDTVVVDVSPQATSTERAKALLAGGGKKEERADEATPASSDVPPIVDTSTGEVFDLDRSREADRDADG